MSYCFHIFKICYMTATIFTGIPGRIRESDLLGYILYFISGRKEISIPMKWNQELSEAMFQYVNSKKVKICNAVLWKTSNSRKQVTLPVKDQH